MLDARDSPSVTSAPVSYTHLDVYKRQLITLLKYNIMEKAFDQYEVWFVTGAQLLYGGDAVIACLLYTSRCV